MSGDRCTGHCCRRFALGGWSYAEMQEAARRVRDGYVIAAMIIPLETVEIDGRLVPYFACKNLLPNGDCGIYETRPEMCRDFPYGRECEYAACTWGLARAGGHPPEQLDWSAWIDLGGES